MSYRSLHREMFTLLRRNHCIWPIIGFLSVGPSLAVFYIFKKINGPETTRLLGHDPEVFNKFENKKYRIYEPTAFDYENYQHPRPRF